MIDLMKTASELLLLPSELDYPLLERILGRSMGKSIDFADLFLQCFYEEDWTLEDSIVKSSDFSIDRGFGLRVISGEKSGFAFADGIDHHALLQAAHSAKSIAHAGGQQAIQLHPMTVAPARYPALNPLYSISDADKVELLHKIDEHARRLDARVKQVIVNLSGRYDVVMMLNSDGECIADVRPLVNLMVSVVVEENGVRERGSGGGGERGSYEFFTTQNHAVKYAEKAVRQALLNLRAKPVSAGTMPVVLGPGWPAVLLHEAIGHGLEGDFNRKGSSAFSGRMGSAVASELCTIVDDATLPNRRGSLSIDDEGVAAQNTVLIENGILKNYMLDKHNAKLMGTTSTGNGRRESYAFRPLPRMTNTYMLPGNSDPEEIIRSVKKGLYAVDFSGGQVDITSGKFVFSMSEAYLIEEGKLTTPVKGATLIGNGPDVLMRVSMVGNNLALDNGIGMCGKEGQSIPVGVGQPTLKINQMTVGGLEFGS
ncbi:MAG: metalloprotease TldD [Coxiella sp. RIFCSPHIGHO2_12_FULL_42_15]|nr:MAG: metalloprotease TldD [Coxiella sp. RIFCSPHIGHO2_12_FULL_42_15]